MELAKFIVEIAVALFTAVMAGFTAWLAYETRKLEKSWRQTSADQIGVQAWLTLEARWDSRHMRRCRKKLAEQLLPYNVSNHNEISEEVLNLFESVGAIYKLGLLNKKLSDSSFGYYACRWWSAAETYVLNERKFKGEDTTLFEDFEYLAKEMRQSNEKIDHKHIQFFLAEEKALLVD